jgi:hypothetical protein
MLQVQGATRQEAGEEERMNAPLRGQRRDQVLAQKIWEGWSPLTDTPRLAHYSVSGAEPGLPPTINSCLLGTLPPLVEEVHLPTPMDRNKST